MKKAATCAAGTVVPVTGSKVAARIAAPAPTEAGEKGTRRAARLREDDEQDGGGRGRQAEGGEEARQRGDPQDAARQLPRQHLARIGARLAQRRAALTRTGQEAAHGADATSEQEERR